eukprot:TRINITY_DN15752_c0_g1_i2.p3 TRINITY_DN15752_c0_g1~~TRINITY_DN15752_c0_g1_i2.p3  ORF type:complete len:134 (+),score=10.38 TRINITY_DN15752_c0_g1_i2:485-886(+)
MAIQGVHDIGLYRCAPWGMSQVHRRLGEPFMSQARAMRHDHRSTQSCPHGIAIQCTNRVSHGIAIQLTDRVADGVTDRASHGIAYRCIESVPVGGPDLSVRPAKKTKTSEVAHRAPHAVPKSPTAVPGRVRGC